MQQNPCYNTTFPLISHASGVNARDTRTQSAIYDTIEEETLLNGSTGLRGGGGQGRERGGGGGGGGEKKRERG